MNASFNTSSYFLRWLPFFVALCILPETSLCFQARPSDLKRTRLHSAPVGRRNALVKSATTIVGGILTAATAPPKKALAEADTLSTSEASVSFYEVIPDASARLSPTLDPISSTKFKQVLASGTKSKSRNSKGGGVIWLGEHHNSAADHRLQAEFIRSAYEERKRLNKNSKPVMAIGLEMVQMQYQNVLDDFVAGNISEKEMFDGCEWEKRWFWPFEVYRPVFDAARELGIPLIALNVNSEDLAAVEKDGLPGLSSRQIQTYIQDRSGFAEFAKPRSFQTYVSYVIEPSYEMHRDMGLLRYTISGQKLDTDMSFRNFLSGRILWDEAMASSAYTWTHANPGGLLIGLVGADHVKFDSGIPGRYGRMARGQSDNISVLLNPTLIDTRPSGSVANVIGSDSSLFPERITLQLRYVKEGVDASSPQVRLPENTGGVLPLADFIVTSNGI